MDLEKPLNDEAEEDEIPENKETDKTKSSLVIKNPEEHFRLGGRRPLKTLVFLSVGPLISQIVAGFYGVIDSMWVAKAMGDKGMSAVSLFSNVDGIGRAFGFFLLTAASSKISSLFGENKGDEARQVICDLIRCCFVCGTIVPGILIPCARPLAVWFGADEETTRLGCLYLYPLLGCSTITCLFLLACGCLQAEGRSVLVGVLQISSFILNMGLFDPLFLLVFKWGILGASAATVFAELLPTILIWILLFSGKFGVKPKFSGLFRKFSPYTLPSLKVGISQLIMNLSRSVPSIFLRKFMGMCAENNPAAGNFDNAIAGFNAVSRIYGITDSVRLAVSMGLLPALSYAYAAKRYKRMYMLIGHSLWINLLWSSGTCVFTSFGAKYLAMTISNSPKYLAYATPMLRNANFEAPVAWVRNVCQTFLQSIGKGWTATLYSFFATFLTYIGGILILYYTDNTDFIRLMFTFLISSSISLVVGVIIVIRPLYKIYKLTDGVDEPSQEAKPPAKVKTNEEQSQQQVQIEEDVDDDMKQEEVESATEL